MAPKPCGHNLDVGWTSVQGKQFLGMSQVARIGLQHNHPAGGADTSGGIQREFAKTPTNVDDGFSSFWSPIAAFEVSLDIAKREVGIPWKLHFELAIAYEPAASTIRQPKKLQM